MTSPSLVYKSWSEVGPEQVRTHLSVNSLMSDRPSVTEPGHQTDPWPEVPIRAFPSSEHTHRHRHESHASRQRELQMGAVPSDNVRTQQQSNPARRNATEQWTC
uniref:Uncharacterized protein n=1 Tax=Setaria digitata TaxID=48799 RepID=A0A915PIE1_9BILA